MLKFSKVIFFQEHFFAKENEKSFEIFEKYFILKMEPSKLNDYLANMC